MLVGLVLVVDYRKHGRTFPNQRVNAGPDQSYSDFRSSTGRCAPSRHPAEDHPQVLIIAPFSGWGGVFGDQAVAAAMIDRVVHHADVLTLKGASYRLRNRGIDTLPSIRTQDAAD
ncbi:ATP-binding protein [Propioniciclava sp. MC1595]|uniref:ATP-binding protein n=1 Tax=Propioniciclava sp. MC1595 TaxID=2760308 RepID=UPI0028B031C8|nr:ATP-binding protein [Propioniciclava sp. MC1595]